MRERRKTERGFEETKRGRRERKEVGADSMALRHVLALRLCAGGVSNGVL